MTIPTIGWILLQEPVELDHGVVRDVDLNSGNPCLRGSRLQASDCTGHILREGRLWLCRIKKSQGGKPRLLFFARPNQVNLMPVSYSDYGANVTVGVIVGVALGVLDVGVAVSLPTVKTTLIGSPKG